MTLSIQKFFLEVNYRVWYTPLISFNIVWRGEFRLCDIVIKTNCVLNPQLVSISLHDRPR